MPWIQLIFETSADVAEQLNKLLSEAGAESVSLSDAADQPLYEPLPGETPLWNTTQVSGLFEDKLDVEATLEQVRLGMPGGLPHWRLQTLQDQPWERLWMEHFRPMQFGSRLWICPSWAEPPEPDALNIMLDPGLAFGSGTHATTGLCLTWLDEHASDLKDADVIDYGCGSGILAIAAARLGARHVLAVDIDPQALTATITNAKQNQLDDRIDVVLPQDLPQQMADVLMANILAAPLISLASDFATRLRPGGQLLLSGILHDQAADLCQAYRPFFDIVVNQNQDGWLRLTGSRYPASPQDQKNP